MRFLSWAFVGALAISIPSGGCGQNVVGRACSTAEPCPRNFDCAVDSHGVARCARTCNLATDTICVDGAVCLPVGSMGGACYVGGTTTIGGSCTSDLDCVRGAICIATVGGSPPPACARGCNFGATNTCPSGSRCSPTIGGAGFCL